MGSSSLLVEQGARPGGLFSLGDRFIPARFDDNPRCGSMRFCHEENILLSRQARKNQRRRRERNSSLSDDGGSRSRSRSRGTSTSSNDSNNRRSDTQDGRGSTHASRQQRQNYHHLLHDAYFGEQECFETSQVENLSQIDATMSTAPSSAITNYYSQNRAYGRLPLKHS